MNRVIAIGCVLLVTVTLYRPEEAVHEYPVLLGQVGLDSIPAPLKVPFSPIAGATAPMPISQPDMDKVEDMPIDEPDFSKVVPMPNRSVRVLHRSSRTHRLEESLKLSVEELEDRYNRLEQRDTSEQHQRIMEYLGARIDTLKSQLKKMNRK